MDSKTSLLDLEKTCRVCLTCTLKMISLFSTENSPSYHSILMECGNITVDENDGLPTVVCQDCLHEMLEVHKFVLKCQSSDKKLRFSIFDSTQKNMIQLDNMIIKEEPDIYESYIDNEELKFEQSGNESTDNGNNNHTKYMKRETQKIKKRGRTKNKRKSNRFPAKCSECDLVLKCESSMIIHMRKHTNERPYECADCGARYKIKNSLKLHMAKHSTGQQRMQIPKLFQCETCHKKFFRKRDLVTHSRIHTGETPYSCKYCYKEFSQISSLIRHTRTHTGERPYECKLCHKRFPSSSELSTHKRVHSSEKNYSCEICNIPFKSKNALKIHGAIHENLREFICDKCGMSFNKKGNLKAHVDRMHSEKAGVCCVCRKRFSKLEDHMRTHTGETPFQCDICNKKFTLKSRLLSHMTYHKGWEKHECKVDGCNKKFPKQSMLVFHILKYHKKHTPFICKHCNRGFYRLSDLTRHLKLNHSEEPDIMQDIKDAELMQRNLLADSGD